MYWYFATFMLYSPHTFTTNAPHIKLHLWMKNDDNKLPIISKSIKRYTNLKQSNTNLCEFISTRWGLRLSSFLLKIQTLFSFPITNLLSSEKNPTTTHNDFYSQLTTGDHFPRHHTALLKFFFATLLLHLYPRF